MSPAYLQLLVKSRAVEAVVPASRNDAARTIGSLSDREREILKLVERGMSNKEIGRSLRIGPETVKWHLKNLFAKLEVPNRIQAVNRARSLSMIG
jgi:LuxR family maltose regulon positive regulatory protein